MKTFAIVPVKRFENSKTRLSQILTFDERIILSSFMLSTTLEVLADSRLAQVIVVSSDMHAQEIALKHGAIFLPEEKDKGVNSAVSIADTYCLKEGGDATIIIPQDLPLLSAGDILTVCNLAENEDKCIVICPSARYDGTNLLLRKPPKIMGTYYDKDSYKAHIITAKEYGIRVKIFSSKRLMQDVDIPADIMHIAKESKNTNKVLDFLKEISDRI